MCSIQCNVCSIPKQWFACNTTLVTRFQAFGDMSLTSGPGRGYRYYTGTPLFSFGHGLSYTTFKFVLEEHPQKLVGDGTQETHETKRISITVTNTGPRRGCETVQFYFVPPPALELRARDPSAAWSAPVPKKKLLGFRKVQLAPHESTTVRAAIACVFPVLMHFVAGCAFCTGKCFILSPI
jgi:hypothetical protein